MNASSPIVSTNGTLKDVAAFFRKSEREVKRWNVERPPRIASYFDGGSRVYLEESVVSYGAKHFEADHRMSEAEIRELVRRQWREHLQLRAGEVVFEHLKTVERRLAVLEDLVAMAQQGSGVAA